MVKRVEVAQRSWSHIALCGTLAFVIAVFCSLHITQNAYADIVEKGDLSAGVTTPVAGAQGTVEGAGASNDGSAADASSSDDAASSGDTTTSGKPDDTTTSGSQAVVPSTPEASDQTTTAPVIQKPEKQPTKAGWLQDTDGIWYYFAQVNAAPQTGWVKSNGKWYWMQPDKGGAMATSQWVTDNGKRYYVDANGVMKTGWFKIGSDWYYANKSGVQQMAGWVKSKSKWYWLQGDKQGLMAENQWIDDKGKRYYLGKSGVMATKWFKIGSDWYYANKSGAQQMNGWVKSGSKWYWLQADEDGLMAENQWITDKNKRYYLGASGVMATKWFKVDSGWYYANKSGAQQMSGWVKSGSKWYWLQSDKDGLMLASDMKTIDNKLYSFDGNGAMRANCQVKLENDAAGYAAGSGAITRIGEYKDGKLVLTDGAGNVLTGWQKLAGKWFYGEAGTGIAQTGWLKLGKTWYYLDSNGAMVTGTRTIDGKSHIFNGSGKWLGTDAMVSKAQGYSSGTSWLIMVDRGAHKVGVFHGSKGHWNRERTFACVTGAPGSPTITGVFRTTGGKRMNLSTDSRARWCTQISGGYFFHTILASNGELGHSLSHGCLRLAVPDAQWIYRNIGGGTTVVIYN